MNEKKGKKMLYRIRKNGTGVQLYSTGGETVGWKANGKIWSSLSAFASHLALKTVNSQKMDRAPSSLFKLYGECTVIELPESGVGHTNEVPFKEWYNKYFETSEKFRPARKKEKELAKQPILAKTPDPKIAIKTRTVNGSDAAARLTAEPVVVKKPIGWDIPTKTTVERALTLASRFVPNLKLERLKEHPKTGETFAHIVISGENYALLKL